MTRNEAIINLKLSQNRIGGIKKEEYVALQMAIEALSEKNIARDIATILENEQDMRVILQNDAVNEDTQTKRRVDHDRDWIIGCIKHDGFIKTDRFDKANQIILDALSADAVHIETYRELYEKYVELKHASANAVQGEWIEREDWNGDYYYDCSVCGESFVLCDGTPSMNLYHFCPNCGARMKGGAE